MATIKVYGADWCHDTRDTLAHLEELGVPFDFLDVDSDPAAKQWVLDHNDGKQKLPTVEVNETILSIPAEDALDQALRANGVTV